MVLISEFVGTSLLVVTFNLSGANNVLLNAVMYFMCVILTFKTSFAQLNPAITFALWIRESKYKESALIAALIMIAQIFGAFLGLEIAMMLRLVYGANGTLILPPLASHIPAI